VAGEYNAELASWIPPLRPDVHENWMALVDLATLLTGHQGLTQFTPVIAPTQSPEFYGTSTFNGNVNFETGTALTAPTINIDVINQGEAGTGIDFGNIIKVDDILEHTEDHGVIIEGCTLEDGVIDGVDFIGKHADGAYAKLTFNPTGPSVTCNCHFAVPQYNQADEPAMIPGEIAMWNDTTAGKMWIVGNYGGTVYRVQVTDTGHVTPD